MDEPFEGTGRSKEAVEVEDAADAYLRTFEANGVDYFFNSPGSEFAPLWDQFAAGTQPDTGVPTSKHGIGCVACRHEELAVHMAMGYTMVTGDPQVVGLHVNVGSLHAAMSILGAYHGRVPLVVVTSHADTHEGERHGGTPGSHYLNFNAPGGFEDHFARYVKWLAHPERNATAIRHLSRAFRVARSTPSGPVLLNLSRELLYDGDLDRCEAVREVPATEPTPGPDVLERVAAELNDATDPLIIAGRAGSDPAVPDRLVELAERLGAPVIENPKWRHGFPVEHPLSLGDRAFVSHYLEKDVDLVFVVDSKRPWYPPESNAPGDATIVMLSPEPDQAKLDYWNYPADVLLAGAPGATLAALLERVPGRDDAVGQAERDDGGAVDWEAEHDRLRSFWDRLAREGEGDAPIDPFWLCGELDGYLPDDAVIVEETTVHNELINNLLEARDRTYLSASRVLAGGRGGGLGVALGTKLAEPDRPVVALMGDGAYNYNPVSAALGAAQEYGLPFVTVIFDNGGYRSQKGTHESYYPDGKAARSGRFPASSIRPKPDYARQAEAWGASGETVRDPADVSGAVASALEETEDGHAAVVDVVVKEESPRDRLELP